MWGFGGSVNRRSHEFGSASDAGCVAFIAMATYYLTRPSIEVQMQEKLVFAAFFVGAILCLGFSFAFHTVHCHSEFVGKLFSKYGCRFGVQGECRAVSVRR